MQFTTFIIQCINLLNYDFHAFKFVYKLEDEDSVAFEVLKMQHLDQFGRDYTVYCVTKDQNETPAPQKKKRAKKEKLPI